ncbi:phosphoric diester hydrolase activity protein [[Candida] boidinii]|nr:phosphoric diester hydrolase activity protein [[Candida] boidinii]
MKNDKSTEPYFQLTILGCSGGPIDGKTCSFLLKPSKISYYDIILNSINDCVIGLDAGTGISGVSDLLLSKLNNLRYNIDASNERNYLLDLYLDSLPIKDYNLNDKIRFNDLSLVNLMQDYKLSPIEISVRLINLISSYLITHVHLDHISGLVINSPIFQQNSKKLVYGSEFTINSLKENLFNDKVWPNLYSNSKGSLVNFKVIEKDEDVSMDVLENTTKEIIDENHNSNNNNNNNEKWIELNRFFKVKYFEVNHGLMNDETIYNSTAYLIKSIETSKLLLMFGDVESDLVSKVPKNYLIWKYISKYILNKSLSHMIIECSSVNLPPGVPLYGHMTPKNLFYELNSLRRQCYKYLILNRNESYDQREDHINFNEIESIEELDRMSDAELSRLKFQPLKDLSLLIIHVKETFNMEPLNERELSPFNQSEILRASSQNSPSPSSMAVTTTLTSTSKPTPNIIQDHISPLSSNSSSLLGKSISSESSQSSFDSFHSIISSDTSYNSDNNIEGSYNNTQQQQQQQHQQLFNNSYYNNSGVNRVMSPLPFERNREESTSSNSTFTSNCSVSTSKNQSNLKLSQSHPTFTNLNNNNNSHSNNNSTSSTTSNNEFNNTGCCKSCSNREVKRTGNLCCGGTRGSEPRKEILSELIELNELYNLGILFTITLPGLNYIL